MTSITDKAIEREIIHIISESQNIRSQLLLLSTHLYKGMEFDDVDAVDIILILEKKFDITIPDEVPFNTIVDFVLFVASQIITNDKSN